MDLLGNHVCGVINHGRQVKAACYVLKPSTVQCEKKDKRTKQPKYTDAGIVPKDINLQLTAIFKSMQEEFFKEGASVNRSHL